MNKDKKFFINYEHEINKAVLHIIKQVLQYTCANGLPGNHHFYIKIDTKCPGFNIEFCDNSGPDTALLSKYPNDITIVLQNAFQDLKVTDTHFSVVLNFHSAPRLVTVPFCCITTFHDAWAQFVTHFEDRRSEELEDSDSIDFEDYIDDIDEDDDDEDYEEVCTQFFLGKNHDAYRCDPKEKMCYFEDIQKKIKE